MQKILLNNELPDLVSVPEAAKYLGVGRKIIIRHPGELVLKK
jgi:hypothetical protein